MGKPVVIGLAGLGTVGQGLVRILAENADWIRRRIGHDILLKRAVVRDLNKPRGVELPEGTVVSDRLMDLVEDPEIEVVCELMGGLSAAEELMRAALAAGKHVVTANKHLLAERGQELFALAGERERCLYYEASCVGGVPVVQALKESLAGNRIVKLTGIMNGTANFILSEMTSNGLDFETALAEAQALGYAEADPSFDIDGIDTAHKLVLLARLAYGQHYPLSELPVRGIRDVSREDIAFAREFGYRLKLIGQVREVDGRLEAGVFPALVKYTFLLARVGGNYNAVRIEGNAVGPIMLHGQGAGDLPTASAVLADIMAIARDARKPNNTGFPENPLPAAPILPPEDAESQYYFRFRVADRPGVMAAITRVMADRDISIAQAIQKGEEGASDVSLVIITHEAPARMVHDALATIDAMDFVTAPTVNYRIL
ncbi:homoserine dehydrogenase [Desulfovibrio sp. X2]|uniref:homoserine dehydrogenase n=1 Tax=Desulfovibrio sp. X2 TaxID=941449 RepID=UPI00035892CE|nr:homoserine dehydrogenase [Desulfovibrio sp. X2]EPR41747.1 homoserine dehydrogenase [Desulfovibrio sp. X2]